MDAPRNPTAYDPPPWNRRRFLGTSLTGLAGVLSAPLLRGAGAGATALAAPRARTIIEIWLWGGACHLDTFDPKPEASHDYTGSLAGAVETNVSGMRLNAALPRLAGQADKFALIRSLTHGVNAHETATYRMQTGRLPGGGLVFPGIGAVFAQEFLARNPEEGALPPYIAITSPKGRFADEGFLGPRCKPFSTGGDPTQNPFLVEGIVARGIDAERLARRRELLVSCDSFRRAMGAHPAMELADSTRAEAWELITGKAREAFDLAREKPALRESYGLNRFGQSCLVARRLAERGVRYISINAHGWDTHKSHFQEMNRMLPELDAGLSTLLNDLSQRGLLESTLVWCCGEFGRTPKILWNDPWKGGRGHFGAAFSALLAGGGIRGGQVIGATDPRGFEVAEHPVLPEQLLGTIYELGGIDPLGPLPNPLGRDLTVLPEGTDHRSLREILA